MRKLILIALALITIQVNAQNRNQGEKKGNLMERGQRMNDFSPEELAQLKTKKMTLALDLTEAQQKQIKKLNLENIKQRKAKIEARQAKIKNCKVEKPNKEERLTMLNERLDKQIEMKNKMKQILNTEQFEKWEKQHSRKQKVPYKKHKEKRTQRF